MTIRLSMCWFVYVFVCVTLTGCGQAATTPSPNAAVQPDVPQLRITNASDLALDRVVVIFPKEQITFQAVAPGATTAYQSVSNGVYGYAAYEITFDGRTVKQNVLDWMGEVPMHGSAFTYVLSVDSQRPDWQIVQHEVRQD